MFNKLYLNHCWSFFRDSEWRELDEYNMKKMPTSWYAKKLIVE
jgi:hypothetical protein